MRKLSQFRKNKYEIYDQGQLGNYNLIDNLVQNPESQAEGFVSLFKVCVMQLYLTIQIITYLIHKVVIT